MGSVEIVSKLWRLCDVLRDDGVSYQNYVTELTYILFLKMLAEKGQDKRLPERFRWHIISKHEGTKLFNEYRQMLLSLGSGRDENGKSLRVDSRIQSIYTNAQTSIRKPKHLHALFEAFNNLDWYSVEKDHFGDLYEGLLEKNANETKSGAGQYFTPRPLIDCMVRLMKPQLGEYIQDPAAGTAGFLIAADAYIKKEMDEEYFSLKESEHKFQKQEAFYGMEVVNDTHRLAMMNLLLHDIEADLRCESTLSSTGAKMKNADLILTNPPFGTAKGGGDITRDDFTYQTSNKQLCFLQHIYRNLKVGGRAAVVLPDNVLFESGVGAKIREDLFEKCNLHTILRLPTGIFYAQGVKTNVLFFTKGAKEKGNTKETWVFDMRANMPSFGKTNLLKKEHFKDFEKAFGKDPLGKSKRKDEGEAGRFRCFSREEITKRDFNLDISWLRDDSVVHADDLPEPEVVAEEIVLGLKAATEAFEGVLNELREK